MDRTQQPQLEGINKIDFVKPKVFGATDHCKLYCMTEVPNETSRFDLYFDAGSVQGEIGIATAVSGLLLSGTKDKTSIEINEAINSLGGFLEIGVANENAVVSIYALKENILPIARILKDAIQNCQFDEVEVAEYINDKKQKFKVSMEKVATLAQRSLKQHLFHSDENYSRINKLEDFDLIKRQNLQKFHREHYLEGLSKMVLIGAFNQDEIDSFMDVFGSWAKNSDTSYLDHFSNLKGYSHIEKEGAVQTAVRVARPLFTKEHPDYLDFLILNTILGDYFGSRLMTNIREDKGYTYGIGTMVAELSKIGYFLVGTEVGKDVKDATLQEIQYEFKRLQTELVSPEELELVKNYMLGQLLKSADGPYSMMDLFLSAELHDLNLDFYNDAISSINNITPTRILELANKYLNWDDFTIVSAG